MIDTRKKHRPRDPHEGAFIETALSPGEVADAVLLEQKEALVDADGCAFLSIEVAATELKIVNQHQRVKP